MTMEKLRNAIVEGKKLLEKKAIRESKKQDYECLVPRDLS